MGRSEDNTSESEDWGNDGWTVDCPCGIKYDDGEEMVECDACRVWVHTRCCRVPKGLTHYVCEKCQGEQHIKQVREEVEVAALLADLPSARSTPFDARSPFYSNSSTSFPDSEVVNLTERALGLESQHPFDEINPFDFPLSQRVHTHGVTGGEEVALAGAPFFSKHLWRHQLMVPKPMDLQPPEVPLHLLLEVDPPDLHGGDFPSRRASGSQGQQLLKRGVQAKVERRKRLMEVVERYEQRRRQQSEQESTEREGLGLEEQSSGERSRICTSSPVQVVESRERLPVVALVANGNACTSASSELSSPGGTTSWTGGYVPRNPYALKKAAVLEYMQTSQSRCASCGSSESQSFHEVKGIDGSVCDSCAARHRDQKYCPHCVYIYHEDEEKVADPGVWLICIVCSRLVHKECQTKKPLNGTGPANRSAFLCFGCARERKKARQEKEAKQQLAGIEARLDAGRAGSKSPAVLRLEELPHATPFDSPGLGLEDECSRPGGNVEDFRVTAHGVVQDAAALPASQERLIPWLSIKNSTGTDGAGSQHLKDGFFAQRLQLAGSHYHASPEAKKAAALAAAEKVEAEAACVAVTVLGNGSKGAGPQETEEAAGVPTPSGPEPELQRRDSDPGSTSVKNGDGRASGGEGSVDSASRRQDRHLSQLPSSPVARRSPASMPQHVAKFVRPGSPSPSSSSNSSSSQAQDSATPCPVASALVHGESADPVDASPVPLSDPSLRATPPPSTANLPGKLPHSLSVPARPKALSLPPGVKKFMDVPDTPGSVTSEHKPLKPVQGLVRPVQFGPSGWLVSSRPAHPTGLRLHHPDGRPSLRQPPGKGPTAHPAPPGKKEAAPAPPLPKATAEMPPPPPPALPKRPFAAKSESELPLNDEELALRLHQELNSSPRMPRVSRSKKPGANGVVPSKRSSSLLATPLRRSQSGDGTEASGSKQESDDAEAVPGEVQSAREGCDHEQPGWEQKVKTEAEVEDGRVLTGKLGENGVYSLPELIETLSLPPAGSQDAVVEAISKHWQSLRTPSGEPYPPLQREAILEALSDRGDWAHLSKQGPPTKRKRTSPPILSDSDAEEDLRSNHSPNGRAPGASSEEVPEVGAVVDGSRVARRKRSRRAMAEFSDTSDADEGPAAKPVPNGPSREHPPSPKPDVSAPKPANKAMEAPPANGNGHHTSPVPFGDRPHANGHSCLPPGRSSSSGRLSNSSVGEEEALSRQQGPPRRKRSRIDPRMELGVRYSGGSGTPEDD